MPENATDPIAARVRAEMAKVKMSGAVLAREMTWHYPHLARRLSGDVAFRADELGRIAAHLNVPIDRFFEQDAGGGSSSERAS